MGDLRQAAFQKLRPICAQLLPLRSSAGKLAKELDDLHAAIHSADPEGLASCLEYVLFPLLFLIDSICATRNASIPEGQCLISKRVLSHCCAQFCSEMAPAPLPISSDSP